ncbi:ABC transporter permease subunit [Amycolatopsis sp. NPDC059657]|uniref:ABC transporter permease subunit n=1 Tax=Amycolatopsis sp. NPDC059657 TaxID=3346899 RepID=UPI00366B4CF8
MTVLRRCALLLAVTVTVGLLPMLAGRDPALTVLRARFADREADAAALASIRAELGLGAGPFGLLRDWLAGLPRGDFGRSWVSGEPVGPELLRALLVSLSLAGFAAAVAGGVAALLVLVKSGRTAAALAALPEFLIGTGLLLVFAVRLGILPTSGWEDARYAVLPSIALGVPAGALLGTVASDAVRCALAEPWVRTWRAAGFNRRALVTAVARRAASVVGAQLSLIVAGLLGGAVAVEVVFAVPGIGRLAVAGALAQDMPVVQGCVLVVLVVGTAAGALAAWTQRALLGPAFAERGLQAPPSHASRRPGWLSLTPVFLILAVLPAGLPRDPLAVDLTARLLPPSARHPFGTDSLGRDLLARIGHGALSTVGLAVLVTVAALLIGLAWGLTVRGSGAIDVANALPPTVAALLVATVAGPGVFGAAVAVACVFWAPLAAHTRSLTLEQQAAQHLDAVRAIGAGRFWILTRHVLPAVVPAVTRNAVVRLPGVALALASLGFLGLGAGPPRPEWGLLLAEGMPFAERAPWVVLFPVAMLVLLGVSALTLASRIR